MVDLNEVLNVTIVWSKKLITVVPQLAMVVASHIGKVVTL